MLNNLTFQINRKVKSVSLPLERIKKLIEKKNKLQRKLQAQKDEEEDYIKEDNAPYLNQRCLIQKSYKFPKSFSAYSRNNTQLNLINKKQHLLINNINRNRRAMNFSVKKSGGVILHQIDLNKANMKQFSPQTTSRRFLKTSMGKADSFFPKFNSLKRQKHLSLSKRHIKLEQIPIETTQRLLTQMYSEQKNTNQNYQIQNSQLIGSALVKKKNSQ